MRKAASQRRRVNWGQAGRECRARQGVRIESLPIEKGINVRIGEGPDCESTAFPYRPSICDYIYMGGCGSSLCRRVDSDDSGAGCQHFYADSVGDDCARDEYT